MNIFLNFNIKKIFKKFKIQIEEDYFLNNVYPKLYKNK